MIQIRNRTLWGPKIIHGPPGPGDRLEAERLLYEHGMDPNFREDLAPEEIEIMAATGKLATYYTDPHCHICGAKWNEDCDMGLHS